MYKILKLIWVYSFMFLLLGPVIVSGLNDSDYSVIPIVERDTPEDNLNNNVDPNVNPNVNPDPNVNRDPNINQVPGDEGTIDTPDYNVPGGPEDDRYYTTGDDNAPAPGEGNDINDDMVDDTNMVPTIAVSAISGLIIGSLLTYYFAIPRRT